MLMANMRLHGGDADAWRIHVRRGSAQKFAKIIPVRSAAPKHTKRGIVEVIRRCLMCCDGVGRGYNMVVGHGAGEGCFNELTWWLFVKSEGGLKNSGAWRDAGQRWEHPTVHGRLPFSPLSF
jgi:hypothetical protein